MFAKLAGWNPAGTQRRAIQGNAGGDVHVAQNIKLQGVAPAEDYGNLYGTPRDQVEEGIENGHELLLNIDVQGARQVRDSGIPELMTIFIDAPSGEELERRLVSRASDSDEVISRRLEVARAEREEKSSYDHVVVNGDFDEAALELAAIVERPVESN